MLFFFQLYLLVHSKDVKSTTMQPAVIFRYKQEHNFSKLRVNITCTPGNAIYSTVCAIVHSASVQYKKVT